METQDVCMGEQCLENQPTVDDCSTQQNTNIVLANEEANATHGNVQVKVKAKKRNFSRLDFKFISIFFIFHFFHFFINQFFFEIKKNTFFVDYDGLQIFVDLWIIRMHLFMTDLSFFRSSNQKNEINDVKEKSGTFVDMEEIFKKVLENASKALSANDKDKIDKSDDGSVCETSCSYNNNNNIPDVNQFKHLPNAKPYERLNDDVPCMEVMESSNLECEHIMESCNVYLYKILFP